MAASAHDTQIDQDARLIWKYMHLNQEVKPAELIFVLGSADIRVAERAAELFLKGYGKQIVVSGGLGRITKEQFSQPEAAIFARIMEAKGVPAGKILQESQARNTGENVTFTYQLLVDQDIHPRSLLLVHKPYMERRTYATFMKLWPDQGVSVQVTSPRITYEDYFTEALPKQEVLGVMLGDLQRIKEYPKLGYQIEQPIPEEVWRAFERLVAAGFTKHLLKDL